MMIIFNHDFLAGYVLGIFMGVFLVAYCFRYREKINSEVKDTIKTDDDLKLLSTESLQAEVIRLRNGIRQYRDQTGHDLCWHNPELIGLLPEQKDAKPYLPPFCEFIQNCAKYRQSLEDIESTQKSEWQIIEKYGDGNGCVDSYAREVLGQYEYMVARTAKDGTITKRFFRQGKSQSAEA